MKSQKNTYDVIIVGGGHSGLSTACILGQAGLRVACIDQWDPKVQAGDLRTTAISYGSSKILERAGIWQHMKDKACPIEDIQIMDGDSPMLLNFLSSEVEDKAFGWIVENADLHKVMIDTVKSIQSVDHITPVKVSDFEVSEDSASVILENGDVLSAKVILGADGRQSTTRKWMDIPSRGWDYGQRAVICCVSHDSPHNNVAVEHFWPEGPFAALPLTDGKDGTHRSGVVFTEHGPKSKSLMNFTDEEFTTALNARFPERYGNIKMLTKRAVYPLTLNHAQSYIGTRMALIADAAHGIHPIAGQGLNLGFRDVAKITDLIIEAHQNSEDIGSDELLESYQRARRFDNISMIAATDALVRLFSNNILPVRFLRRAGLKMVSKLRPAKHFFMKEAMGDR